MTNLNWLEFNLNTFFWIFIILNIINVIIQTIKTIVTINGSPFAAALINAVTFAIYTVVVVFMNADGLGIVWKGLIIGIVNFIGVYVVKWWEEKTRKEKLWKVEATIAAEHTLTVKVLLTKAEIPNVYLEAGKYTVFNCYCSTKKQSKALKEVLKLYNAKYFVSETKML